jgi:hypothetical protein
VKTVLGIVLLLVIGFAAIGSGIYDATLDEPLCNGHVQARDETCAHHRYHYRRGTTYRDYESQKAQTAGGSVVKIGVGLVFVLIPTAAAVAIVRRRRRVPG